MRARGESGMECLEVKRGLACEKKAERLENAEIRRTNLRGRRCPAK